MIIAVMLQQMDNGKILVTQLHQNIIGLDAAGNNQRLQTPQRVLRAELGLQFILQKFALRRIMGQGLPCIWQL
jgi:hypothetical protein